MSEATCFYCANEATLLCDGRLGWVHQEDDPRYIDTDRPDAKVTCDRPLCRDHARMVSQWFLCGKDGGIDTEDLCPHCDHTRRKLGTRLVSPEDAEALRRRQAFTVERP